MLRFWSMTLSDGGKRGGGNPSALDLEQAEQFAAAFRPAWEAEGDETSEAPVFIAPVVVGDRKLAAPATMPTAITTQHGKKKRSQTMTGVAPPGAGAPMPDGGPAPTPRDTQVDDLAPPEMLEQTEPMPLTRSGPTPSGKMRMEAARSVAQRDPFRPVFTPPAFPVDDSRAAAGKSKKGLVFAGLGLGIAVAIGLFIKLGTSNDALQAPTAKTGAVTAAPPKALPSPTDDIPPPPEKDDLAPAPTEKPAAAAPAPAPTEKPPAAAEKVKPAAATAAPKPTAAAAPAPKPAAAAPTPKPPRPATQAPATAPKSTPKAAGGGIVRDNPF